jgi:hypothetical protein
MRRLAWTCLAALLGMVIGCGRGGGAATPEAAFESYKTAMADKDFEGVWQMLSAASQQQMEEDARGIAERAAKSEGPGKVAVEKQARLMDMTMDQVKTINGKTLFIGLCSMAAKEGKEEWEKLPRGQFARVEVNANRANVYVKVDDKVETDHPLPLVLEGGKWKIDMTGAR